MAERACDGCGKKKDLKGGKTCDRSHFLCKECVYKGTSFFNTVEKKYCPLCEHPLR